MLKRYLTRFFCAAGAIAVLTSCGDSKAGGTGEYATVIVTATPPVSALDSDVATWVDQAGVAVDACTTGITPTITADNVQYRLRSEAYPGSSTIAPSDLLITDIVVSLTPANGSPSLSGFQSFHSSPGQRLTPNSTTSVPVTLVPVPLKSFLRNSLGAGSITCTNPAFYSYWAVVSFFGQEVTTGKSGTITAPAFMINFSDFID